MICPDCGIDYNKLNKKGICLQCASRINQLRYRNKVNNENEEYVPLISLKDTNPVEYNRILKKRKTHKKRQKVDKNIIKTNKTEMNVGVKNFYYAKVYKDIAEIMENDNISNEYLQHNDLDSWMNTFFSLLQDDNFMTDAKSAEIQLNNLQALYRHALESVSWEDIEKVNEISYELKALQELRRPTKNILDFYSVIDPLIMYLKKDETFMSMVGEALTLIRYKKEHHDNPKYVSKVDVPMARESDFVCDISPENKAKLYDCTVWCFNLHGNSNKSLFRAKNGIWAKNEAEAKLKLKNFLNTKFETVTYKDIDIEIKEVESIEEIQEEFEKMAN